MAKKKRKTGGFDRWLDALDAAALDELGHTLSARRDLPLVDGFDEGLTPHQFLAYHFPVRNDLGYYDFFE
jgi:hypothetical protein